MDRIRGFPIYHAIKPGVAPAAYKEKEKKIKNISTQRLIKNYLCCGADSRCAVSRQCECLDACQYGQQYIKQTSEEKS
jgi:hypothetical protein